MNRIRRFVAAVTAFAAVLLCSFYSRDVHPEDDGVYFDIDTLATNLNVPWQICFLPDATMLFTERTGAVRLYRNGKLSARPVLTVKDIRAETKTGLLGMAIHPDFNQNHWVYLAQNYAADNHLWLKIVQYQYAGDSLIKGKVLLQNIPAARNHTGCRLIFGMDKKLYLISGDADQPALAQDLKALNGKILRINDDGSIPADNPFTKNDTARKEIWSYGHRNPQGLVFHPQSAVLYESEHGPTGGDEVNIIRKGENYGWPVAHHRETREAMVGPLLEYTHYEQEPIMIKHKF
ncbi:MAG: PQQ-dependent sugar dehydrogenase [Pedobacter agri]